MMSRLLLNEVRVRREKRAQYVQGISPFNEHQYSRKLYKMFKKLGWKEIKARGLLIPKAENDPYARL